jgi:Transposase DDE domain group 1
MWTTRRTWSRRRDECKAKYLYEKVYCARGEMENRIKECQLDLYADRTSAAMYCAKISEARSSEIGA